MDIYKKVGGRYKKMGMEFTGFPCNGFWIVKDGSSNCILQLDSEIMRPVKKLDHLRHVDEILKTINKNGSTYDTIRQVCEYFDKEENNAD